MSDIIISGAVEGLVDEAVLKRLIKLEGAIPGVIHVKNGKEGLKEKLAGYNYAAARFRWIVLMDMDHDADCAPILKNALLPNPSQYMCFRLAVRTIETWLIADRESLASFLSVAISKIPSAPESLEDPKRTMIELANRSRRREIREGMVPRPGSGRKIGSDYTFRLIEFVHSHWKPEIAVNKSDSLYRCRKQIRELITNQ